MRLDLAPAKRDPAFAVIIALVAVTVLTLLAGAFAYAMKIETKLAANTNDDEDFYWIGRGGVERACWWLAIEGNQPYSSLEQYWAGGPGDGPETNSMLAGESLDDFPVGNGTVSLKMVELESKININTADGPLLQQVLSLQGVDAGVISEVSDSILDWIDPDDNTRPAGAESDYYLGQTPSYYAKNAPMDSTEELLLVRGVTHKMYYNDSRSAPSGQQLGFGHDLAQGQEPDYAFGLQDVFTAYSSGQINVLTADETVLQAIPGMDTATAEAIVSARSSEPPARSLPQLLSVAGIDNPQAAGQLTTYVKTIGNTYEIHATATIGPNSHEYTAIVYRNGPNVHVVSFYRSK